MLNGALRHAGWAMGAKVLGGGAAYALAWAIGQQSGAGAYGRFELVLTVVGIGAMIGRWGMDGAWVRHLPAWRTEAGSSGWVRGVWTRSVRLALAVSVGLGAALVWGREAVAAVFHAPGLEADLAWAGLAIPGLTVVGLAGEVLRADQRFRGYALLQRGSFLLVTAGAVWAVAAEPVAVFAVAVAAVGVGAVFAVGRGLGAEQAASGPAFRELLRTAGPLVLVAAAFELMTWTDTLMCGAFLDEVEVGRYRLAFRLAALLTLGQTALNSSLAPRFPRASSAEVRSAFQWAYRWNAAIALGGGAFLWFLGPWLAAFFGKDFASAEALLSLRVLAVASAFNALSGPVLTLMNTTGAERPARTIVVWAAVVNAALNAWAIPRWGIAGAAAATGLTTVGWNVAAGVWVWRRYGIWPWWPFNRQAK